MPEMVPGGGQRLEGRRGSRGASPGARSSEGIAAANNPSTRIFQISTVVNVPGKARHGESNWSFTCQRRFSFAAGRLPTGRLSVRQFGCGSTPDQPNVGTPLSEARMTTTTVTTMPHKIAFSAALPASAGAAPDSFR